MMLDPLFTSPTWKPTEPLSGRLASSRAFVPPSSFVYNWKVRSRPVCLAEFLRRCALFRAAGDVWATFARWGEPGRSEVGSVKAAMTSAGLCNSSAGTSSSILDQHLGRRSPALIRRLIDNHLHEHRTTSLGAGPRLGSKSGSMRHSKVRCSEVGYPSPRTPQRPQRRFGRVLAIAARSRPCDPRTR